MKSLWGRKIQMSTVKLDHLKPPVAMSAFLLLSLVYLVLTPPTTLSLETGPMIDSGDGRAVIPSIVTPTPKSVYKKIIESNQTYIENVFKLLDKAPENVPTQVPPASPTPNSNPLTPANPRGTFLGNFALYKQCDYTNVTMWGGCTICKAGCGITAAAMVISSLKDSGVNPQVLHEYYRKNGFQANCDGSYIGDAKSAIASYGLQTTANYIFRHQNAVEISQVASDIRGYIQNGWYVFALAEFCQGGCGHYFIITDIDAQNRITSFDPYYEPGSVVAPISYLNRSPFPKFRVAFAVKKT